jgi:myotubularin-related protein 6/7/8
MIAHCVFRASHPLSRQQPSIRLRGRDFSFVAFQFFPGEEGNQAAQDVYDSIRSLTCKLGKIEKLYAFKYLPSGAEKQINGWELYDARREWKRQGISEKDPDRGWRISEINAEYQVGLPLKE